MKREDFEAMEEYNYGGFAGCVIMLTSILGIIFLVMLTIILFSL